MVIPAENDGTLIQSTIAPVDEVYDSVSKLRFAVPQFADEVAKTKSAGSWLPFGAVVRFWMLPP